MMPFIKTTLTLVATAGLLAAGGTNAAAESSAATPYDPESVAEPATMVVPIDWTRFKTYSQMEPRSPELEACSQIFLNTVKYNLPWSVEAVGKLRSTQTWTGVDAHNFIRPVCNVAFGFATALKTGMGDRKDTGLDRGALLTNAVDLIRGATERHRGNGWGYPWQSALWAAYLGNSAWLLWDSLDAVTRNAVVRLVEWEANRFLTYEVPYWNGLGGDTKAEENAWNSMVLSLAVAMMPHHPNVRGWKEKCSELMVSAYATQADMQSPAVVDGKVVKDWLRGYNAREDGSVVNHGFIHPDYILCIRLNLRAFIVQPLAFQPVPEAADFNAALVYRCLVTKEWSSPPYAPPGGAIYKAGESYLYYPEKADWGRVDCLSAYLVDTHAFLLGLDSGLAGRAQEWMRIRAAKILEMQERHPSRRVWAPGEYDTWVGSEQTACGRLGNAFLALWLNGQEYPVNKANWLAE
jgi:hypothetical protein